MRNLHLQKSNVVPVKSEVEISQNFVAFSLPWKQIYSSFYFVDLTATDRYYNPNLLPNTIRHTKIKTKGHVVPDYQVVQRQVF